MMNNKKGEGDLTLSKLVEYTIGAIILLLILLPFISYFIKVIFFPPPSDLHKQADDIMNEVQELNNVGDVTMPLIFLKEKAQLGGVYFPGDMGDESYNRFVADINKIYPKCAAKRGNLCICLIPNSGLQECVSKEFKFNNNLYDALGMSITQRPIDISPGQLLRIQLNNPTLTFSAVNS